jgi:SAM-dependent methyltransferase
MSKLWQVWHSPYRTNFENSVIRQIGLSQDPEGQELLLAYLQKNINPDTDNYLTIRKYVHDVIYSRPAWRKATGHKIMKIATSGNIRENSRVRDILPLISNLSLPPATAYLDVGCAEGKITAAMGQALHLPIENIWGTDIIPLTHTPGFIFTQITDPAHLPYASESVYFMTALMSLHHMTEVEASLREMYRVAQPGAILVVREHDNLDDNFAALLDVLHAFYMYVWPVFPETQDYYAQYRSRSEWRNLLSSTGFKFIKGSEVQGPWRYYYDVYIR